MQIKQHLAVLALVALLGGCASTQEEMTAAPADAKSSSEAIAAAKAAQKKAASVKGEWRDTGKIIKKAEAAAKKGDYEGAVKLAAKAQDQGELGYAQAVSQKELKMPSYLKY
jgi:osmotically-inducible protein OsmY